MLTRQKLFLSSVFKPLRRCISTDLRQRSVVSSFICTPAHWKYGFTFALFRRSPVCDYYPGKWAICSGSIEPSDPSPEAAALREITEETGLTGHDVKLLRRGKPYDLVDVTLQTKWKIHPFAWQLKQTPHTKPLVLNNEHVEVQFISPYHIKSYDHVPQLERGLKTILVNSELEDILERLSAARSENHSWQDLTILALDFLRHSLEAGSLSKIASSDDKWHKYISTNELWFQIRWYVWQLENNGIPKCPHAAVALRKIISDLRAVQRYYAEGRKKGGEEGRPDSMADVRAGGEGTEGQSDAEVALGDFRRMAVMRILETRKEVVDKKDGVIVKGG